MFWDEEKIGDAHRIGRFLGPLGRMLENLDDKMLADVCLYTKEHGKIWYGDIDLKSDENTLKNIAMALKQTVYIIPDSSKEGYDKPMHEGAWAIIEVE